MNRAIAKDREEVEQYRQKLFKSKQECRWAFASEPFEKKVEESFELYRQGSYLKKFRPQKTKGLGKSSFDRKS